MKWVLVLLKCFNSEGVFLKRSMRQEFCNSYGNVCLDDAYGISVPAKYQTTKEDISEILKGFQRDENNPGYEIYKVRGWDYPALCETYQQAIQICRDEHVPVLIHVTEVTQPQGHSTSGSHERYKDKARLEWEKEFDCIRQMRIWMLESAIVTEEELAVLEDTAKKLVREAQKEAGMNSW